MSLAIKRLKNLGWLLLVFIVALLLYPLSLKVASEHSDLVALDRKIQDTKREIDFLEAEIRTRASMAQLEEWNAVLYGYAPPTADQFIEGEQVLANLNNPDAVSKPVLVSVSSGGVAPAGLVGSGQPTGNAGAPPLTKEEQEKLAPRTPRNALVSKDQDRTDRLARMDQQLLSEDTLKEIEAKASREEKRR